MAEDAYVVGQVVNIIDGAFSDFSGTIETLDIEKQRMKVLVKIFGKQTPVELTFDQVNKI